MWATIAKLLSLLAIICVGVIIVWLTVPTQSSSLVPATAMGARVAVEVTHAAPVETWESKVQFSGIVKAKKRSELSFERMGRVEQIMFEQGQSVQAGQVLATLNKDLIESQIRKLEADRRAAVAGLDEMKAGPRKEIIEVARASVTELDTQLKLAVQLFERRRRLFANDATSKEDLEQSSTAVEKIQASKIAAQKTLDDLELGTRKEKITMQEATIAGLEELITAARIELGHCALKAPFSGTIIQRTVHPGVVVQPGSPVFIISSENELEAQFGVPPTLVNTLKVGQDLSVEVRGQSVRAVLKTINPQIDDETRTMRIVAALELVREDGVYAGDVAALSLRRSQPVNGYWLPLPAVMQGQRGLWECWAIEEVDSENQGKIAIRQLEVLHVDTDRVLVRGDLIDADLVVASATNRLVQGQTVTMAIDENASTKETKSPGETR